jgi:hypothetical protein
MNRTHTPQEERRHREAALDHTLEESFPASDPLSTLPNPDDDEQPDNALASPQPDEVRDGQKD